MAVVSTRRSGGRLDTAESSWLGVSLKSERRVVGAAHDGRSLEVLETLVQMPDLDGLDATRRIRESRAAGARRHIVAITANAMREDRDACFAAGMDDYVAKPIRPDELAEALRRATPASD